jgi:hypothetical protein
MTTRRAVLMTAGGAALVAGAGAAGWALTRAPSRATAPWDRAGESFGDARLDALAYAILAPNPHNLQPWRVRLIGDDALEVTVDPARLLPHTDPFNRQSTIGLGCFLELFRQAAAEKQLRADIALFPDGEPFPLLDDRPIARLQLIEDPSTTRDPLFAAALIRRTDRGPYDSVAPDPADIFSVLSAGGANALRAVPSLDATIREIALEAWRIEWALARTRGESINVTRIGKAEIEERPDGVALSGPFLEGLALFGALTRDQMNDPSSSAYAQSLKFYEEAIHSSPAFVFVTSKRNQRSDQIAAGASWVRMNQGAALAGLALHPLSQALQEFPEMAAPYRRIHALLAPEPGATVQMLARIGRPKRPAPPAPRWEMQSILVSQ